MRNFMIGALVLCLLATCKTSKVDVTTQNYPPALQKVFSKHGGLQQWQKMNALTYQIIKSKGNETQYVDLKNRREKIEAANFKTGFDGENIWLEADTSYKGNPIFYHNLMFYFYAMPFVLADDGIIYTEATPLTYEGKSYPGFKISYEDGIGISSKDEYFIHYNPMTYEMAWLGYTVTYFSKEKSKKIRWIRYKDWEIIKGLTLPKAISWFIVKDKKLVKPRNTVEFDKVTISENAHPDVLFDKPRSAKIVKQ